MRCDEGAQTHAPSGAVGCVKRYGATRTDCRSAKPHVSRAPLWIDLCWMITLATFRDVEREHLLGLDTAHDPVSVHEYGTARCQVISLGGGLVSRQFSGGECIWRGGTLRRRPGLGSLYSRHRRSTTSFQPIRTPFCGKDG